MPLKFGVIRGKSNRTDAYHDGGGASLSAADSSSGFMISQWRTNFPNSKFRTVMLFATIRIIISKNVGQGEGKRRLDNIDMANGMDGRGKLRGERGMEKQPNEDKT